MNLFQSAFAQLRENEAFKWDSYFRAYEDIMSPFLDKKNLCILEIGVSKGGSLDMWAIAFDESATIVGIDIDPACQLTKHPPNVHVHIIDQSNPSRLAELANRYGGFDIIIDDGAHTDGAIKTSLFTLWPHLRDNGVYIVEDIHGTFWSEDWNVEDSFLGFMVNETVALQRVGSRSRVSALSQLPGLDRISMHWSICAFIKSSESSHLKSSLKSSNGIINVFSQLHD